MSIKLPFRVERAAKNVHVVRIDVPSMTSFEQWFLCRSDAHHDSVKCDRKLEKKHLEMAKERGAAMDARGSLGMEKRGLLLQQGSGVLDQEEFGGDEDLQPDGTIH